MTKHDKTLDPDHIDPGHFSDLDRETFMAWGKLVFGEFWKKDSNLDAPPDLKEIARLLRLGKPVPPTQQAWLADLLDPPSDGIGYDGFRLILAREGRAAQKFETEWKGFNTAISIAMAMERGKSLNQAIDEVMPGKRRQGYAIWSAAQPWFERCSLLEERHPGSLKSIFERYGGK
jgi:hypothetical protein